MAQNIYDDPDFLAGYATLERQVRGLDGAAEWPTLRSLLPEIAGQRVVDLGCGFGWFSRWADEQGAVSVVGIDASARMLERAAHDTRSTTIEYRRVDLDELELTTHSVDVAFSSLTLHYVLDLDRLLATVRDALVPGGALVFSVEHPILSAPTSQEFLTTASGERVWPLDRYLLEGPRVRHWYVDGVEKQHRTIATYVNAIISAGLELEHLVEWGPTATDVEERPELADDLDRPWFLLARVSRRAD